MIFMDREAKLTAGLGLAVSFYLFLTHQGAVPLSYDFGGHISRVYILLHDGTGWTNLWYNGYHLFHFYSPLYYFLMLPFASVSMNLVRPVSFAIFGITAFFSMYYYAAQKLNAKRSRAAGLLFLSGWLLYVVHVSGSMPQAFAAALVPFFFAQLQKALDGKSPVPAGIAGAAIVMLHHNAGVVAALGAVVFLLMNLDKDFINAGFSGIISASLSAFWLLPAAFEFGNSSYGRFHDLAGYGLESIVMVLPLFTVTISVKALASLDSVRDYRQEASLGLIGALLSLGYFTGLSSYIPIVNRLPPYRIYLLSAFVFSFLAAASRKKLVYSVAIFCVAISMVSVTQYDDRGFREGQLEAYNYLEQKPEGLVYDDESTDIRAYGLIVHEQRIADGWSVGSTSVRKGLRYLGEEIRKGENSAAEFLRNWSADYVVAYNYSAETSKLKHIVEDSDYFRIDRCFKDSCVYSAAHDYEPIKDYKQGRYIVNASKTIPVPYSYHFNSSTTESKYGFTEVEGEGLEKFGHEQKFIHSASLTASIMAVLVSVILYFVSWSVPERYSKDYRAKVYRYVRNSRRRKSR